MKIIRYIYKPDWKLLKNNYGKYYKKEGVLCFNAKRLSKNIWEFEFCFKIVLYKYTLFYSEVYEQNIKVPIYKDIDYFYYINSYKIYFISLILRFICWFRKWT